MSIVHITNITNLTFFSKKIVPFKEKNLNRADIITDDRDTDGEIFIFHFNSRVLQNRTYLMTSSEQCLLRPHGTQCPLRHSGNAGYSVHRSLGNHGYTQVTDPENITLFSYRE